MKEERKIGIYKITNIKNGHVYIGQSTNIKKRWNKHKSDALNKKSRRYNSTISRAFRRHGMDNFNFTILEECDKEFLDEREIYWISYYNSFKKGYNETLGGQKGKREPNKKVIGIIYDLEYSKLTFSAIAKRWNVSIKTVDNINSGRAWYCNREYPIRKNRIIRKKIKVCSSCGCSIDINANHCINCYSMMQAKNIPTKEHLLSLILRHPLTQIGDLYNVSSTAVKKWCIKYDLPYIQKDIKALRNRFEITEWHRNINNDATKKSVIQYDLEHNVIHIYSSIREAATLIAQNSTKKMENIEVCISHCCRKKQKTAYGYIWEYNQ